MEFTKKIKSLVNLRQASRSSVDLTEIGSPESEEPVITREKWKYEEVGASSVNKAVFYSDESFDASEHKLKEVPEVPDINEIANERTKLVSQLHVVSKKLSDLILQNQSALAEELQCVTEMQKTLEEACTICGQSRNLLAQTKQDFTTASLGILASYRKREQLKCLLRSLCMIKTLQETDVRLRELLEEEDYPGAIQLCLECQKAASTFKHFSCISELSTKLQDTLVMTEEQLDVALSKVCTHFDKVHYEKLQEAYSLLGKTQTAVDQLLMHFASAIHNTAFTIVLEYAEKNSSGKVRSHQKRQYSDLCQLIDSENFTSCLVDLCKALWQIMHSYWCILEWHDIFSVNRNQMNESVNSDEFNRNYIHQKLEHGLLRVWQDVQQKVKSYILASDMSHFKFDEFIHILALIQRLIDIGEDFCGSRSEDLQESVRKQSVNYFRNYHRGFMEELRTFLENESWGICPVHSAFSAVHLQEFRFLARTTSKSFSSPEKSDKSSRDSFFKKQTDFSNPFDEKLEEEEKEDILSPLETDDLEKIHYNSDSDDSEIPDELKKEFIDENAEDIPRKVQTKMSKKSSSSGRKKQVPILTNTALNVLRSFGKYMQMMSVLKPIAFDVLICMTQLFDYYMYSVYIFFAKEMSDLTENILSNKLKTTLKRIRENLMVEEGSEAFNSRNKDKIPPPALSVAVDLKKAEDLYGLAERVAAAESLVFLAEQFELLHPHLELLIPSTKRAFLQQFCSQTVSQAAELRRPVYMAVAARSIDYEQIVVLMSTVKWDVNEIMSQHSSYVDILLRELQVFSMRLSEVSRRVPVPKEAYDLLWEHCIRLANHSFIEGFSGARKCTNGGRALMQLDYQQFVSKLEKLTELQPLPGKELVESYIKAYYMLEQNLEQWIRSHKEYTNKQLIGLVSCITQLNKKGRQRLINLIEEGDKLRLY
ncbi:Syndetin like protein [Argiope bruennichi]|uniref:Syndetin like protein n=1 Tax=Argiope bruennichi TaxID=94029 RepID=A0A8T0FXZ1_ARGBR|nr:Syndetin like protein [Argiope bruennichi]